MGDRKDYLALSEGTAIFRSADEAQGSEDSRFAYGAFELLPHIRSARKMTDP
jgi:hypothetical protein